MRHRLSYFLSPICLSFALFLHWRILNLPLLVRFLMHLHYNLPLLVRFLHKCISFAIINVFCFLIFVFYPIGGRRYCSIVVPISVVAPPSFSLPPFLLTSLLPPLLLPLLLPSHKVCAVWNFLIFFDFLNLFSDVL